MSKYINVTELKGYIKAWCSMDEYYHDKKPKNIPLKELDAIIDNIPKDEIKSGKLKGYIKASDLKKHFALVLWANSPQQKTLNESIYKFIADEIDEAIANIEEADNER